MQLSLNNPAITIADPNDIEGLVTLVNSAYRGESSTKGWTTEASLLDGIRTNAVSLKQEMDKPGAVILKYLSDNKEIIGCVYLEKKGNQLYLGMLTVSPLLQAKGTGKQLLSASEVYAKEVGCDTMIMTVISVRHELIAWYARHGYRDTGETRPFPTGPEFGVPKQELQFIVMEKQLG